MELTESVLQEVQFLVTYGFENRYSLYVRIFETMAEELGLADEVSNIEDLDAAASSLLADAIEEAFARKEEESRSWPAATDCDRLRKAFDVLNKQGIVALENCGSTQVEGIHRAALVAVARDELGSVANDGYCFFHEQDVMHAIEGDGLWLAFGAFGEQPQGASAAHTPSGEDCPNCHGRGWIQPDPNRFPEQCPHLGTPTPYARLSGRASSQSTISSAPKESVHSGSRSGDCSMPRPRPPRSTTRDTTKRATPVTR